jgi:hypothetical protein
MRPIHKKLNDFGYMELLLAFDEIIGFDKTVEKEKMLALSWFLKYKRASDKQKGGKDHENGEGIDDCDAHGRPPRFTHDKLGQDGSHLVARHDRLPGREG